MLRRGVTAHMRGVFPPGMSRRSPPPTHLLAMMAAIVAADSVHLLISRNIDSAAPIIPDIGILLSLLIICPVSQFAVYFAAGAVGIFEWGMLTSEIFSVALISSLAKAGSVAIAALLLRRRLGRSTDITRSGVLPAFAVICCIGTPLVSAGIIAVARASIENTRFGSGFGTEFLALGLGLVIVSPLMLAYYRQEIHERLKHGRIGETLFTFTLLAFATAGVFAQAAYPFLFLTFPPLLLVVGRLGFTGAVIAVPMVAVIATGLTFAGHGPIHARSSDISDHVFVLQVFLATSASIALAAGVIVSERRRLDMGLVIRETRARFAEAKLRSSEQLHRLLSENASDIISRFDLEGRRLYISPSAHEILGWSESDMLDDGWQDRVHPDDRAGFQDALENMRLAQDRISATYRYAKPDGNWAWIEARLRLVRDSNGNPTEFISNARDITHQKVTEQALANAMDELSVLATTDGLTGLANRRRLDETLRREWRRAMRAGEPVGLLMIDADRFKLYNDTYGHQEGDACLRAIATTMASMTRRPGDLCARYGGEEFAVILPATTIDGAIEMGERIRRAIMALERPHSGNIGGVVTVSIGAASFVPERHSAISLLVNEADEALYAAKNQGRNRVLTIETVAIARAPSKGNHEEAMQEDRFETPLVRRRTS